ncbi:hypothetical protein JC795_17890 [Pseudomonas veronii]|uniref:hypothetical protein n=1 Tax=Pseudomonas veronii TaxID=76761 RepID=UPI0018E8DF23|nr:hypothetical protein [Pseudomonas veronii]MBJ2180066.1 hypothetical protein [Pseudomonas veronii]
MNVRELMALLAKQDPDAMVVLSAKEGAECVAEFDLIQPCTVRRANETNSFMGDYRIAADGVKTVWLGWSEGYDTEYTQRIIQNPNEELGT